MRLVSVVTAIIVAALLYGLIIERERFFALINGGEAVEADAVETTEEQSQTPSGDTPDANVIRVMATRSTAREIETVIRLRGETDAMREVSVVAETSGKVVSDPLRKGAFVDEGQLLCALDAGTRVSALTEAQARLNEAIASRPEVEARIPEAIARLSEARARLDEATINDTAARSLSSDGFASQTRVASTAATVESAQAAIVSAEASVKAAEAGLNTLQANIESAEAGVARAQIEIDRLQIHAPFAGLLESDSAELGSLLQAGALCATVIQLDPIKIVGFVPEAEIERVKVGAPVRARINQTQTVEGRVEFVSRSADMATRTFRVELSVPNPDLRLRDGQTAEIFIEAQGVRAHLLASSVLTLNDEGALGVRTVDAESKVTFVPVTVLRDTAQGVYLSGLPDTADVITVGQEFVTAGVKVAPVFEEVIQ